MSPLVSLVFSVTGYYSKIEPRDALRLEKKISSA